MSIASFCKNILRFDIGVLFSSYFTLLMLFQHFSFHLFIGLFHFLHFFLCIVHYPTERFFTCNTLTHSGCTCCTEDMSTFYLNWASELLFAFITNFINLILFYGLESLFNILFSSKLWVADPSPSLFFCTLKIPLLFPPCLVIGPIMEIDTTVTERTVTRVMPIFTESKVIIKSTCISDGTVDSRWSLSFSELFLCIDYLILGQCIVGIVIQPTIYFSVNLALFDVLGNVDILHVLLFCQFLL